MRQSGLAWRFIRRTNPVPDHVRDHGRAMIGDDDKLQSVGQGEVCDFRAALLRGERVECQGAGKRNERQSCSGKHDMDLNQLRFVPQYYLRLRRPPSEKVGKTADTVI